MANGRGTGEYVFTQEEQKLINAVERKIGLNYRKHDMHHKYIQSLIDADLVEYIQRRKKREETVAEFFRGVWADAIRWVIRGGLLLVFLSLAFGIADATDFVLFGGG